MTSERAVQIGIDRLIRLDWLERSSSLVLAGNTTLEIKHALQHDLCNAFKPGVTEKRGSLDKTLTILMKVWLTTPNELFDLRNAGLDFIRQMPCGHRKVIHWGMLSAVYPFWANVARQTGRLINLQGNIVATQVQRRMKEQYGERQTVSRTTQRVLRSYVDWGVLRETCIVGVYEPAVPIAVDDRELAAWLIEAVLLSGVNGPTTLKSLIDSTALFPFRLPRITAGELVASSTRLDVITHNLNDELVVLKRPMTACDT